jgi:cellulose synthase/poly-beta-1,6-N-acetylglucosamine synthase-like glycosyltransferase
MELLTYGLLFVSLFFEVFLLVSFLEKIFSRSAPNAVEGLQFPTVAIVVPCFNEERGITGTLQSLLALEYPKEKLEIIVVDDGSMDKTLKIARTFESDPRIRVFTKENGGKHTAMNFALAHTDAEFIGCLDADSVVDSKALMHIVHVFTNPHVAAVTPGIHAKETNTLLQHMQKVEYRLSLFNRFMLAALGSAFITPGPFSIFRASVVHKLGGWKHGHATEDMEMALRIQHEGHLIANCPAAVVYTSTPPTVKKLFKQRVRWTYGFIRNAVDYRHMVGARQYGNLGMFILPTALISIATAIYFFVRLMYEFAQQSMDTYTRIAMTESFPMPHFELFYVNTSAMWVLVWLAVALVLVLISAGGWIGTGSKKLPIGTPLFILFYCFLVPTWLATAVFRATFRMGVRWR